MKQLVQYRKIKNREKFGHFFFVKTNERHLDKKYFMNFMMYVWICIFYVHPHSMVRHGCQLRLNFWTEIKVYS